MRVSAILFAVLWAFGTPWQPPAPPLKTAPLPPPPLPPPPLWKEVEASGAALSVERYLLRLGLRREDLAEDTPTALTQLVRAQLAACPFENLDVYLATEPTIDVDLRETYDKVVRRHRGGFCFEVNVAFGWLLRCLGFDAKFAMARVWRAADPAIDEARASSDVFEDQTETWDGANAPTHVIVFVEEDDEVFLCDVGFGDGPKAALPLVLGQDIRVPGDHAYRFARADDSSEARGLVTLYRLSRGSAGLNGIRSEPGTPEPRILFDTNLDRPKTHFEPGLLRVQTDPDAIFNRFLLVVRHDLDGNKLVLQGRRLRICTNDNRESTDTILETREAFLRTLADDFLMTSLDANEDRHLRDLLDHLFDEDEGEGAASRRRVP